MSEKFEDLKQSLIIFGSALFQMIQQMKKIQINMHEDFDHEPDKQQYVKKIDKDIKDFMLLAEYVAPKLTAYEKAEYFTEEDAAQAELMLKTLNMEKLSCILNEAEELYLFGNLKDEEDEATTDIETDCPFCNKHYTFTVQRKDYVKYKRGMHVQEAFPYLDEEKRELLISNICPECWGKMFDKEDIE